MRKILIASLLSVLLSSQLYAASDVSLVSAKQKQIINATVAKLSKKIDKELTVTDIKTTPIAGIFEVTVDNSIIYISKDGQYIINGDLLDLNKDKSNWSLTQQAQKQITKKIMASSDPKDMIIYPIKNSTKKIGIAYVFTDIDCQYCHKMQEQIDKYADLGIEIRYLSFPRAGPGSQSFEKAITVWCSDDRQRDLTLAMQGEKLAKNLCANNPVMQQFTLARTLGVNGTPTVILENGSRIVGFLSPNDLAKAMQENLKQN